MIIDVKNVSISRDSKYILKDVSWEVEKGQHWAILGLNGSGKTTLLNMLNGYIFPSKGDVNVLGKPFGKYDLRELRKSIGWVSTSLQERLYGNEKALDIVISGRYASIGLFNIPTEEDQREAQKLLALLDADSLSDRSYGTLSQGEKQRILIARGLMSNPRLLILDEPCTGLDIFSREQLLKTIDELSQSENAPTLVYVTHQTEEILPAFNHTLLMRRGEIHSKGRTDELLTKENLSDFFEAEVECKKAGDRYVVSFKL
jgi:iron complex transport system ATP-binding protein